MSRIFSALANAASKYGEGRFKRKIYDDQQAQKSLENERRAFEFAALQGFQRDQLKAQQQQRDDQLQRQREADVVSAQQNGYEDTPVESVGSGVNAYLQSQGMGGPATAQAPRAAQTKAASFEAEGVPFTAEQRGAPQYATVGGRVMRYDPQRPANEQTRKAFESFMKDVKIKRDIAQENQAQKSADQQQRAIELATLRASLQQPRQPRTQIVKNDKGEYVIVDLNAVGPTGLKAPVAAGPTGAKAAAEAPMRAALKDLGAQVLAQGEAGEGLPEQTVLSRYLSGKKGDYKSSAMSRAMAGAAYASAVPEQLQKAQNFVDQIGSVLLPLRGGKAITEGEKAIIMGAVTVEPGESPAIRRQKMEAFERLIAPILATGGGDINQEIAEMRQRAAAYRKAQGSAGQGAAPWETKKP